MIVLGLTGSVGMGKTEVARALARRGYPVFNADAEVHRLLAEDRCAIAAIRRSLQNAGTTAGIDRVKLGAQVFRDPAALRFLEHILHPRVRVAAKRFLAAAKAHGAGLAVLEIPLLFETRADRLCEVTVVVSAPAAVQMARVLARPGMTKARLQAMLARQMSDGEKRRRATYVVDTGSGRSKMLRQIAKILEVLDPFQP